MNKKEFVNQISRDQLRPLMRKNVILLGDIVEDIDMVDESRHSQCLKVGYLNSSKNEHLFDYYSNNFDIVIRRDGPLVPVNLIMDTIIGGVRH